MFIYLRLTVFCFLCTISSSLCDICVTCSCSTTLDGLPIIDCHERDLERNDMLISELLMLDENKVNNKLILSKNQIINLSPHLLKKLRLLKSIDLSENFMKQIYIILYTNLNSLEDLNLSKNAITTFDDLLLREVPSLLTLNLSYNQIDTIQHTIGETITNINSLDLSHNNISNFPNKFFDSLTNLQYLDLSFNRINSLEEYGLTHLNSLKTVYINNNFLTSLHMKMFPKSLLNLYSGYNLITEIFYEPSEIEVLNIEYNRLFKIRSNAIALKHLKHLNVSGNILSDFPNILCENLKTLDISCNNLSSIPETLSTSNFPLLATLNVSKNPIRNLMFRSELNLQLFVASNISILETIDKATFAKLRAPAKECINLIISNNKGLSLIHEEAFKHMNLCSLDISNNQIAYIAQKLVPCNTNSVTCNVNLQGNPLKCNCSLQWILDDMMPKLYHTQLNLLDNLRCAWPPQISKTRMLHWYGWKDRVFCTKMLDFNEKMKIDATISQNGVITFNSTPGLLAVLGVAIVVFSILIIVGIIWTQRLHIKRRRVNRKF
ncbi:protein artichoke-like [Hylaeus volcanicus]|uniref:protein artichoke-like n=1 Tax=Hylaeus volcanicus TaxID=313075 RepID=UPI0023B86576|nr:protein artichoke-like [Hylaeus volcanicus]